jgi:hypothetical protein
MKTLSIVTVAIILGLRGAAMAGGDSESQQSYTNATGPNPLASGEDRGDVTQLAYSAGAGRDRL